MKTCTELCSLRSIRQPLRQCQLAELAKITLCISHALVRYKRDDVLDIGRWGNIETKAHIMTAEEEVTSAVIAESSATLLFTTVCTSFRLISQTV